MRLIDYTLLIARFFSRNEFIATLKSILGFYPIHLDYYKIALLHSSSRERIYLKNNTYATNNERLEFLGDAILGAIIADILFQKYPKKREGELSAMRSKIVRRSTLDHLANETGISKLIHLDSKFFKVQHVHISGNAFEAIIGAIYVDRGIVYCRKFIDKLIRDNYINIREMEKMEDSYKSTFIEWAQKNSLSFAFNLISEERNNETNTTVFTTEIIVEDKYSFGKGEGYNKRLSQQRASEKALKMIKNKNYPQELKQKIQENREEKEDKKISKKQKRTHYGTHNTHS